MCRHENRENLQPAPIVFEEGLFGFEAFTTYMAEELEEGSDAVLTLKSVDEDGPTFVLMNPFYLMEDYRPALADGELASLGDAEEKYLSWYVICVVRTPIETSTVNLKCPLVVNTLTAKGRQVMLTDGDYGLRHPLSELISGEDR